MKTYEEELDEMIDELAKSIIFELAEDAGVEKWKDLKKQQLSKERLQGIADDAGQVMRAFVNTCQQSEMVSQSR